MSTSDPLEQVLAWHREAADAGEADPDAMTLATATTSGRPSARIVLFRGVVDKRVCFYTNYESRKGAEIAANPWVALSFYWQRTGKQIRIEGRAERLSPAASDEYFRSRPAGHQLNALASAQSREIASHESLVARYAELEREFQGREIPRPEYWGGFGVLAERIEFWVAGVNRLHERIVYERTAEGWRARRLSP